MRMLKHLALWVVLTVAGGLLLFVVGINNGMPLEFTKLLSLVYGMVMGSLCASSAFKKGILP